MQVKEVIIVEGKDDIARVKSAIDGQVFATGGSHISSNTMKQIKNFYDKYGVIVLTDPDYAGEKIRKEITKLCPGAKQAYVDRELATKNDDVGIENASYDDIIEAIKNAKATMQEAKTIYTLNDLIQLGLSGPGSKNVREKIEKKLKIGHGNSKQLLNKLNFFAIEKKELISALEQIKKEDSDETL